MRSPLTGVGVVVVVYNTPFAAIKERLAPLSPLVTRIVIFDNTIGVRWRSQMRSHVLLSGWVYLCEDGNVGIGAAQNAGIEFLRSEQVDQILLLDDDSRLSPSSLERLSVALMGADESVVAVAPVVADRGSQIELVFRWSWRGPLLLDHVEKHRGGVVSVPFLISSGSLFRASSFDSVGPLRSDLFIDHVDIEWGIRASGLGYRMEVLMEERMSHSLGDRLEGKQSHAPRHEDPSRSYYQARNAILVARDARIAPRFKFGLVWMCARSVFRSIGRPQPFLRASLSGLLDGLRMRSGPR